MRGRICGSISTKRTRSLRRATASRIVKAMNPAPTITTSRFSAPRNALASSRVHSGRTPSPLAPSISGRGVRAPVANSRRSYSRLEPSSSKSLCTSGSTALARRPNSDRTRSSLNHFSSPVLTWASSTSPAM
jgi:hypothetical protein